MPDHILQLQEITKSFGGTQVLRGISIDICQGEFITFLGSSGCGKTTTLRIIAGLEEPDSGRVLLEGRDVTALAPNKRDVNTVFQNYALFPHMTVGQNIAYSLRLRKAPKEEQRKTVEEMLDLVQLSGYERRMPSELSGGQRQRVAIARALASRPRVLLLDEPLGALDLQLRRQMQVELGRLQKKLGVTFLYITHDQEEALNMSDRIVVMREGRFEQIGTPSEVYDHPRTAFVARFVGSANIFRGRVAGGVGPLPRAELTGGDFVFLPGNGVFAPGSSVAVAVRSEQLQFHRRDGKSEGGIRAAVKEKSFAGGMLRIAFALEDGEEAVASRHGSELDLRPGEQVLLSWDPALAPVVEEDAP